MYDQQESEAFSPSHEVPALLSHFIDPILKENKVRIVERFLCGFETDPMLGEIGICLRWVPFVSTLESAHVRIIPTSEQLMQAETRTPTPWGSLIFVRTFVRLRH